MSEVNAVVNPFLNWCRVCAEPKRELNDLFTTFMDNISLAEMLAQCTQKTISMDDGLSPLICIDCMGKLIVAFEFHTLSAASEAKVRQFLIANTQKIPVHNDAEPISVATTVECAKAGDDIKVEIGCTEGTGIEAMDVPRVRRVECVGKNWRKKTFECLHCRKLFPKMYNLRRHIRIHDETGKPFECTECRWRFSSANNLKRHAIKHTIALSESTTRLQQPTSFPCRLCARAFEKRESLASHMKIHKNEALPDGASERFSCELCKQMFGKGEQLRKHMRGHDEMKVHQCNICSKRFSHNGTLIDHMNRHNGIKPHQCPYCEKCFHQSCTLKEHIRTHNGETRTYSTRISF